MMNRDSTLVGAGRWRRAAIATSALAVAAMFAAPAGAATTFYWDIDTVTTQAGAGGSTPSGQWDNAVTTNFSTNSGGTGTKAAFANSTTSSSAVFAAGSDATGAYDVTVSGTVTGTTTTVEEGSPTFKGTNTPILSMVSGFTFGASAGSVIFDSSLGTINSGASLNTQTWTNNSSNVVTVNANVAMRTGSTRDLTLAAANSGFDINGVISGGTSTAKLIITGGSQGVVTFKNTNTYGGLLEVRSGTLVADNDSALTATRPVTINGGTLVIASGRTVSNPITIGGQVGGTGEVFAGTLRVNGATQTGAITLTKGTISGSGTINQALTFGTDLTLSPGNSPGNLNGTTETWADGGTYHWEINNATGVAGPTTGGTGWDLVTLSGGLTLSSTTTPFKIEVASLDATNASGATPNFDAGSNYKWMLANTGSDIAYNSATDAGLFNIDHAAFDSLNNASGTWALLRGDESGVGGSSSQLYLTYTASVPEPGAIVGLAGVGLLGLRRRRANSGQ
jgi:MYXO-CTERM domain-containing protein